MSTSRPPSTGDRAAPTAEIESARTVVYPWSCDWMGHLATQHYMKIFDDATCHLLGHLGYRLADAPRTQRGWADVSHAIEYRRELVAGDLVVAYSVVKRVGTTSLSYSTRLVRATHPSETCALLNGVMVYFDLTARRAIELPDPIRLAAESLLSLLGTAR